MLIIKANLIFNNEIVGHRIILGNCFLYDISVDDLELISEDFNIPIVKSSDISAIALIPKGNKLISVDGLSVQELTYSSYAANNGKKHLSKTDSELKKLYNHYNKLCFNNTLPQLVGVEWSSRMTSGAGVCERIELQKTGKILFCIRLSTHYHEKYPNQVIDTLVHEMIHVLHPDEAHGSNFKRTMQYLNRRFGFNISIYSHSIAKVNYIYTCFDCGKTYERARALDTSRYTCGVKGCKGTLMETDLRDR